MSGVGSLAAKVAKMLASSKNSKSIVSTLKKEGHDSSAILKEIGRASKKAESPVLDNDTLGMLSRISKKEGKGGVPAVHSDKTVKDFSDDFVRKREGSIADKIAAQSKRVGSPDTPDVITGPATARERLINKKVGEQSARVKKASDQNLPALRDKGDLATVKGGKESRAIVPTGASEAIKKGGSLFDALGGRKGVLAAAGATAAGGTGLYLSEDDKKAEEMQVKIDDLVGGLDTSEDSEEEETVPKGPEEWEKTLNGLSKISYTLPDKQQKMWEDKIRDLKTVRDEAITRNEWLNVAETLGQALVQLGAGYHGLRTGRDLSGIQFKKNDWGKSIDQILDTYKMDVTEVDSERTASRKMTRERADLMRQKILEKSRGQRQESRDKKRHEAQAQKDMVKIEENLAKKSEKEIAVLEKKKDKVDQLMLQYDQASGKSKRAIKSKLAPALFNLYKGLGVDDPMGRVGREMKEAEVSGWFSSKFDPTKIDKTAGSNLSTDEEEIRGMTDEELRTLAK